MKIMLLGETGQVAFELRRTLSLLGELAVYNRREADLEDGLALQKAVRESRPKIIVNAAAYTAVDRAEEEPERAGLVNATAPGILAEEARKLNALLVHYSTDFIFDGAKKTPYTEKDNPRPLNVYGQTKLEGERNIRAAGSPHLIFRTAWVYGIRGKNFLVTMRRLAREKKELRVVNDQVGAPTWCRMIAEATALVLSKIKDDRVDLADTYHLTAGGETSWYGFARAIFNRDYGSEKQQVSLNPISTDEYPTLAKRPLYSVLSSEKVFRNFGVTLPDWEHGLDLAVESN